MIIFEHDDWKIVVNPEFGGVITLCQYQGKNILRPATPLWATAKDPTESSYFPLVPFSNRIENGAFTFGTNTITLPRNRLDQDHTLHGDGWTSKWQVQDRSDQSCVLAFDHISGPWPWPYRGKQSILISENRLKISLSVENIGETTMPAGLGFHPYFVKTPETILQFRAGSVCLPPNDRQFFPQTPSAIPKAWDYGTGQRVDNNIIDHCFTGWDGRAVIMDKSQDISLSIEASKALHNAVLYSPDDKPFFCFEPVSHRNGAFNSHLTPADAGLRLLKAGDTMTEQMELRVKKAENPIDLPSSAP